MLPASPALLAILNGTSDYLMADLYTLTLSGGTILRWTSCDIPLVFGGQDFDPAGKNNAPGIVRGTVEKSLGLAVSTLDLTLHCGDSVQLLGIPMPLAAHNGAFDNAQVQLDRTFMATWGDTSAGAVPLFYGNVGEVNPTSTTVKLNCRDIVDLLNVQMPKNLFLPMCSHLLYDPGCGISKAAFTISATIAAGASVTTFHAATSTGKPAGYFQDGVLTMTSGAAAGATRAVMSFDGTQFILAMALPAAPAAGDTFTVSAGCPRDYGTCGSRFSNQVHFRGFKDVPPAETAI
jgi:uncharacterized phage protein (TIGR02218 family)